MESSPPPASSFPHAFTGYVDLTKLPEFPKDDRFVKVKSLGNALYGKVYLMEDKETGGAVAMKKMPKARVFAGVGGIECAQNEIAACISLQAAAGPHNIKFLGAAQDANDFYLATEYCEHGELFNVLAKLKSISDESVLKKALWQILVGLRALHRNGVAHRDVSAENVFVASDGTLRLADYGQAVVVAPGSSADDSEKKSQEGKKNEQPAEAVFTEHLSRRRMMPGKVYYRSPEMFVGPGFEARPFDIFACGVILYALRFGNYPFEQAYPSFLFPPEQALWRTESRCTKLREQLVSVNAPPVSPALADFLELLLSGNPKSRPTADEALTHPWFMGNPVDAGMSERRSAESETTTTMNQAPKSSSEAELGDADVAEVQEERAFDRAMSDVSTEVGDDEERAGAGADTDWNTPPATPWTDQEEEDAEANSP